MDAKCVETRAKWSAVVFEPKWKGTDWNGISIISSTWGMLTWNWEDHPYPKSSCILVERSIAHLKRDWSQSSISPLKHSYSIVELQWHMNPVGLLVYPLKALTSTWTSQVQHRSSTDRSGDVNEWKNETELFDVPRNITVKQSFRAKYRLRATESKIERRFATTRFAGFSRASAAVSSVKRHVKIPANASLINLHSSARWKVDDD